MRLRMKIMAGFLILAVMLAVAGAFSIYELLSISSSIQGMLDNNYRSIDASRKMIEALEREDSGLLLILSGKPREGGQLILEADKVFQQAFSQAKNNLTIRNEVNFVEAVDNKYRTFRSLWIDSITGNPDNLSLDWYFERGHQAFQATKTAVDELMALNDDVMYETASRLESRMHRIIMPGIVAVVSALIFALIFNYFINHYFVNPLISITKEVQNVLQNGGPFGIEIETNDELKDLASAIRDLSYLVQRKK